jgi:hypothetical protein
MNKITRFEVIDDSGRVYVNNSCEIELSYQDDDRTLKVFIKNKESEIKNKLPKIRARYRNKKDNHIMVVTDVRVNFVYYRYELGDNELSAEYAENIHCFHERFIELSQEKTPNEETLKAFEDVENKKDLTKCNSVEEMFEKLEKEEIENFSDEELKTSIGHLMLDLRGSWSWYYKERSLIGISLIKELLKRNPSEPSLLEDLELFEAQSVLYYEYVDGRVFRDNGILYGYSSENGRTERVHEFLKGFLLSPYDSFEEFSENE